MFRSKMFELVELKITAQVTGNNQQVYFEQQPQLQTIEGDKQIYVKGIEAFSSAALPFSPITTNNPVASVFDITNATLTLDVAGTESFKRIPLALINRAFASAGTFVPFPPFLFMLKNVFAISWTKSYCTLVQAPPITPFSYLFGVHYDYVPDDY